MNEQVPFYFVVEIIAIAAIVLMAVRTYRYRKNRPLSEVLSYFGLRREDLVKIPKKTLESWDNKGTSYAEFVDLYRHHVEHVYG